MNGITGLRSPAVKEYVGASCMPIDEARCFHRHNRARQVHTPQQDIHVTRVADRSRVNPSNMDLYRIATDDAVWHASRFECSSGFEQPLTNFLDFLSNAIPRSKR